MTLAVLLLAIPELFVPVLADVDAPQRGVSGFIRDRHDGQELGFISTGPANQTDHAAAHGIPSNVEFGVGDEANILYVTIDTSLYRMRLGVKGYRPY